MESNESPYISIPRKVSGTQWELSEKFFNKWMITAKFIHQVNQDTKVSTYQLF